MMRRELLEFNIAKSVDDLVEKSDGWKWEGPNGDDAGERRYKRKDTWPSKGKQPKRKVKVLRSGDAVQKNAMGRLRGLLSRNKQPAAVPYTPPKPGQPGYGPGPTGPVPPKGYVERTSTSPMGGPTGPGPTGPKPPPPLKGGPLGRPKNPYGFQNPATAGPSPYGPGPTGPRPLGRTSEPPRPPMTAEQKRAAEMRDPNSKRRKILDAEAKARRAREMREYNALQLAYKDSGQRPA